jgi:glycosyltransferase involved in cell wall biosynthesis
VPTKGPIAIISSADFTKSLPPGGEKGFISGIIGDLTSPVVIYGIGLNGTQKWKSESLTENVQFIPTAEMAFPSALPMRFKVLWAYLCSKRRLLRTNYKALYIHSPECALPFLFGKRKTPIIYHQHGSGNPVSKSKYRWARAGMFRRSLDLILKVIHKRADWIIAIDGQCFRQAVENGAGGKVSLINNAVDTTRFVPAESKPGHLRKALQISEEAFLLLFVGRLEEVKRVDQIIEAVGLLRIESPAIHLWVIGDGSCRADLQAQVTKAHLAPHVSFLGNLSNHDLPEYYNAADALVLASEMEGVPMAILEALACGTPVIAPRLGGISDIIIHGVNGFLLDEPTPIALSTAIRKLRADTFDRHTVASSVHGLSSSAFVAKLESIIESLSDQRTARREAK